MDPSAFVATLANPTLPPEILDQIFGFLHPDIDGLKACSEALSTTSLRGLSDSYLYRNVCVYTGDLEIWGKGTKMLHLHSSELSQLLQPDTEQGALQPNINKYIHYLCISIHSLSYDQGSGIAPLLSNPLLMPCLNAITLTGKASKGQAVFWQWCDLGFRRALFKRLAWTGDGDSTARNNGVIKTLTVYATGDFPYRVLERCPGLKKICLEDFAFAMQRSKVLDPKIDVIRPSLHQLSVKRMPTMIMGWLIEPVMVGMIANLRILDIDGLDAAAWDNFSGLLELCKETLEKLTVDVRSEEFFHFDNDASPYPRTHEQLILTPNLVGLHKLKIVSKITSIEGEYVRRGYGTSLKAAVILLKKWWFDPTLVHEPNMKTVELQVDLKMTGLDPPSLAEIDFEPLLDLFPVLHPSPASTSRDSIPSPNPTSPLARIKLKFVSAKHNGSYIPFSTLRADIEDNEVLSGMIMDRKVKVLKS